MAYIIIYNMKYITLNKNQYQDLYEIIMCAYKGDTDIKAIVNQLNKLTPIEDTIQIPSFAIKAWKDNEILDDEIISNLTSKITVAESFLKGLKDTPDDVSIGTLRSFIDANYENIIKK